MCPASPTPVNLEPQCRANCSARGRAQVGSLLLATTRLGNGRAKPSIGPKQLTAAGASGCSGSGGATRKAHTTRRSPGCAQRCTVETPQLCATSTTAVAARCTLASSFAVQAAGSGRSQSACSTLTIPGSSRSHRLIQWPGPDPVHPGTFRRVSGPQQLFTFIKPRQLAGQETHAGVRHGHVESLHGVVAWQNGHQGGPCAAWPLRAANPPLPGPTYQGSPQSQRSCAGADECKSIPPSLRPKSPNVSRFRPMSARPTADECN